MSPARIACRSRSTASLRPVAPATGASDAGGGDVEGRDAGGGDVEGRDAGGGDVEGRDVKDGDVEGSAASTWRS
jgi:hypothetical protein